MDTVQRCIESYRRLKNLKLVSDEVGIPWQRVYVHLKNAGEPVTGDKLRYGNDRDRLAALAESMFEELVPFAENCNAKKYQAKVDFIVNGQQVDVKASMPRQLNKRYAAKSWSFSFKKQSLICDFVCCFCMNSDRSIKYVLLVPSEFFAGLSSVSVSCCGDSKWLDYTIDKSELAEFFKSLKTA